MKTKGKAVRGMKVSRRVDGEQRERGFGNGGFRNFLNSRSYWWIDRLIERFSVNAECFEGGDRRKWRTDVWNGSVGKTMDIGKLGLCSHPSSLIRLLFIKGFLNRNSSDLRSKEEPVAFLIFNARLTIKIKEGRRS